MNPVRSRIYKELVQKLISQGVLKTPEIIEAFLANDRKLFVPKEYEPEAYLDVPLPIGEGQTISQPYTVAFMIELLQPKKGQTVLDIGFGSGWTTGILAAVVGEKGKVCGLEIVPELYRFGKSNLEKLKHKNIELFNQSGWEGLPTKAPFQRILVSAVAPEVPKALKGQLKVGGKMVIPLGTQYDSAVTLLKRTGEDEFEKQEHPGFAFVPFIEK